MIDEQLIVKRAKNGDSAAFEQLVTVYEKKIYNLAFRSTRNEQDSLDIAQDVFLRVYRFLPSFNENSTFSTWIYRITMNVCKDFAKKRKGLAETSLMMSDDDFDDYELQISDIRYNPEIELERKELRRSLQEGLDLLPQIHKEVLILREFSGNSYAQIGEILSLDIGTVKSRIARAREKLRELLSKDGTFDENSSRSNIKEKGE